MTSAPAVGHLAPILGVGRALRDAGHTVRVATHPERHGLINDAGLEPVAAGMSGARMEQERALRWPETTGQPNTAWAVRMFTQILAPTVLADLLRLIEDWRPDLIVHEEGEYAGPVGGAQAGIPWVTHAWGSPLRPVEELVSLEEHAVGLWTSVGLEVLPSSGLYRYGLVDPCPAMLQVGAPGASVVWPVRPAALSDRSEADTADTADSADAYVGFGTVPRFADDFDILAAAARSCAARGLRTVVTTTNDEIAARLSDEGGGRVLGRTFVSLTAVLQTCQVVVCHGGAGTVLAALSRGVPLVIVSKGAPSQVRMAEACANAGVAAVAAVTDADADANSIETAVNLVLDTPTFRQRAETVAGQISAMPEPAALIGALEAVV